MVYRLIDTMSDFIGRAVSWLCVAMVLMQFWLVITRYVFSVSSLWQQELIVYLHGIVIMLGCSYTLLHDGHVRIDILFQRASFRTKKITDIVGYLIFLLPVTATIAWAAYPDVSLSWRLGEGSTETSGIAYKFLLKTTIIVLAALLALQAVSEIIKSFIGLLGGEVSQRQVSVEDEPGKQL